MKTYQKILLLVIILLVLAGMVLPFLPLGVVYYGFDFNNGLYIQGKRYIWGSDSYTTSPSSLSNELARLKLPVYPPLIQTFDEYDYIPMKKAPYPRKPKGFEFTMLQMQHAPGEVPKSTPHDILEFRDELLNKFGNKETIEKAIAQGAERGGYIPNAHFEVK